MSINGFDIVHLHLNWILNSSVSLTSEACWSWMLGRERKFSWLRPGSKKVRGSQLWTLFRGFQKAWRRLEGWKNVANLGQPWTSMEITMQKPHRRAGIIWYFWVCPTCFLWFGCLHLGTHQMMSFSMWSIGRLLEHPADSQTLPRRACGGDLVKKLGQRFREYLDALGGSKKVNWLKLDHHSQYSQFNYFYMG